MLYHPVKVVKLSADNVFKTQRTCMVAQGTYNTVGSPTSNALDIYQKKQLSFQLFYLLFKPWVQSVCVFYAESLNEQESKPDRCKRKVVQLKWQQFISLDSLSRKCRRFWNSSRCLKTPCDANNWPIWTQQMPNEA